MKLVTVHVTRNDIENGLPCLGMHCPIAVAINRELNLEAGMIPVANWHDLVFVDRRGALANNPIFRSVKTPEIVRLFIRAYDDGRRDFEPFEFSFELPEGIEIPMSSQE